MKTEKKASPIVTHTRPRFLWISCCTRMWNQVYVRPVFDGIGLASVLILIDSDMSCTKGSDKPEFGLHTCLLRKTSIFVLHSFHEKKNIFG